MRLFGSTINKEGHVVSVEILTMNSPTPAYEIGDEESGIYFADDAVEIISEINDTFDSLICRSASIRLQSAVELTGLYCSSCMQTKVTISEDGRCVFAGFIEPQSYSQPFNSTADDVEINCIDALSALQYMPYADVTSESGRYADVTRQATIVTMMSLIKDCCERTCGEGGFSIFYDNSRKLTAGDTGNIFDKIGVSELLFLGEDEDSVWTYQDVLTEIMKYLSLHIEQDGTDFYIYSWATAKRKTNPEWMRIAGNGEPRWTAKTTREITLELAADTDTTLDMGETYNLITLKCEVSDRDTLIESPLNESNLTSDYARRQKYVTCISSYPAESDETGFQKLFRQLCGGTYDIMTVTTDRASFKDWYFRLKTNDNWRFLGRHDGETSDLYADYSDNGTLPQEDLPNHIGTGGNEGFRVNAALVSWGNVENIRDRKDNSPQSSIEMEDYLVIAIDGQNSADNISEVLQASAPLVEYTGNTSGFMLSPSDDSITNYIVFSGKMLLSHIAPISVPWGDWIAGDTDTNFPMVSGNELGRQRLYTRKWWKTQTPCGPVTAVSGQNFGLTPPDEDLVPTFLYNKSRWNGRDYDFDNVSKVAVLACMLRIGDKVLVETGVEGQVKDYMWQTYKPRESCLSDDEYYEQTFTLGINPKIGDYLVGTEYDIQNNVTFDMGIDIEGTAIPIRHSDKLSGQIVFQILGPVNSTWDDVLYRYESWFHDVDYRPSGVKLLTRIQNIYIKDFEVNVVSDNGLIDNGVDGDLVYMSDTDEQYVNKKEDLSFRITSALTSEERFALGFTGSTKISSPVDVTADESLLQIHNADTGEDGKPEQMYVDEAWRMWHLPRVQMSQTIDEHAGINRFDILTHPALPGKRFFIQGISRNLMTAESTLNLKEADDD